MVVALIILGVVVVTALSISLATIRQRKASIGSSTSSVAYQNAESGVEAAMTAILNANNKSGPISSLNSAGFHCDDSKGIATLTPSPGHYYTIEVKDGNDAYITSCSDATNYPISKIANIKSIGYDTASRDERAIEAAVAGNGPWTSINVYRNDTQGNSSCNCTAACTGSGYTMIQSGCATYPDTGNLGNWPQTFAANMALQALTSQSSPNCQQQYSASGACSVSSTCTSGSWSGEYCTCIAVCGK